VSNVNKRHYGPEEELKKVAEADSPEQNIDLTLSELKKFHKLSKGITSQPWLRKSRKIWKNSKRLLGNPTQLPRILRISRTPDNSFMVQQRNSGYFLFTGKLLKRMEK